MLPILLKDWATGENIIWATDSYCDRGFGYRATDEIQPQILKDVVRIRAQKASSDCEERTRGKAEVFTPSWICCLMNNALDEIRLGQKEVLFAQEDQAWQPTPEFVKFGRASSWQNYVKARCLEITCGEAPFLVSRYDAVTGEMIEVPNRIGLLDRKLRIIRENVGDRPWFDWVKKAYQTTYGYEFQGDNLIVARVNLLMSFVEYYQYYLRRKPTHKQLLTIAEIISKNVWQMDGLEYVPPLKHGVSKQTSLFDLFEPAKKKDSVSCKFYHWTKMKPEPVSFSPATLQELNMKFDYIVGNPPYQEEVGTNESTTNNQIPSKNIFQFFQINSDLILNNSSILIYPAGRWIHRFGKGLEVFGKEQINDSALEKIIYYADANEVFPSRQIADGISIVIKSKNKHRNGFKYEYIKDKTKIILDIIPPGDELIQLDPRDTMITDKIKNVVKKYSLQYLSKNILPRSLFGIESDFVEKNPDKVREYHNDSEVDFSHEIKLFTNDKAGKAGRSKWYIANKNVIQSNIDLIEDWQVVVSSANAGGQKRDNQLEIIDNHSAFGRSRVALRSFKTEQEAINFYNYVRTYIIRFAFLMTDEALSSLGKLVPDFDNYSNNNPLIDYSKDIETQLIELLEFNDEEFNYIKNRVNNYRNKQKEMT